MMCLREHRECGCNPGACREEQRHDILKTIEARNRAFNILVTALAIGLILVFAIGFCGALVRAERNFQQEARI